MTAQSRVQIRGIVRGWLLLLFALLVPAAQLSAQSTPQTSELPKTAPGTQNILNSYDGQNVTAVEIAGRPDLDTSKFMPLLPQHAGEPFSQGKTDQSIDALKRAGNFNEVQLQIEPEANGVRVLLIVEPAIWFGIFEFPGAERFNYSRLVQVANYPPQAPFNAGDVQKDSDALLRFFQQQGYFEAEVRPQVKLDTEHNLANVRFMVSLNRRAKFGTVAIADTTPEEAATYEQEPPGPKGASPRSSHSAGEELSPRNTEQCNPSIATETGEARQAGRTGKTGRGSLHCGHQSRGYPL